MTAHHPTPARQLWTENIAAFALEPPDNLVGREGATHFGMTGLGASVGTRDEQEVTEQVVKRLCSSQPPLARNSARDGDEGGRTDRRSSMGQRVLPIPTSLVRENRRYSSST